MPAHRAGALPLNDHRPSAVEPPQPVPGRARGATLTVTFCSGEGDVRVYSRSPCFRLCADGTLRSGDNSVAAAQVPGGWRVGRLVYRDFDCAGPVMLVVRGRLPAWTRTYGPCDYFRAVSGQLFAGTVGLRFFLPGADAVNRTPWHEALLLPAAA